MSLAGCQGFLSSDGTDGDDADRRQQSTGTDIPIETPTQTPTETVDPYEQVYTPDELDEVLEQLDEGSVSLNLVAADEEAEYAESTVYDKFNGDITVEVDMDQAIQQRRYGNETSQLDIVQDFAEVVANQDDERVQEINEQYLEVDGEDILGTGSQGVDWDIYTDESRNFRERMLESGLLDLWYKREYAEYGIADSTQNHIKAQALQQAEREAGFDTYVWRYESAGHGLMGAVENPTRNQEETDQQQTYVMETVPNYDEQIVTWENSKYSEGNGPAPHPIDPNSSLGYEASPLEALGKGNSESNINVNLDEELVEDFNENYRNPGSAPFMNYSDQMISAAYISEESGLSVDLGESLTERY